MDFIEERIKYAPFRDRVISAKEAAAMVQDGMTVSIPEFGAYTNPMAICDEITKRVTEGGETIRLNLVKTANANERLESSWANNGILKRRMIFFGNRDVRREVNTNGGIEFQDIHLGLVPDKLRHGLLGKLDFAIVGCGGVTEDGKVIPGFDQGYTPVALEYADKVLLEISRNSIPEIYKLHDVYTRKTLFEGREAIPLTKVSDRIGDHCYTVDPEKVVGIVISDEPLLLQPMWNQATLSPELERIGNEFVAFLEKEIAEHKMPEPLPPIQTGAGAIADAVFRAMGKRFDHMTMFTEGFMNGAAQLLIDGKIDCISSGAFSCDSSFKDYIFEHIDELQDKLILRSSEVSNSAEIISRLGVIAMNNALEVDIYGHVNSTNAFGSRMISGIGGSGDYARNAFLTVFFTFSTAMKGAVSSIVPMVTHVDHTEHDVDIIVTEQGIADLRNKSPRERVVEMIKVAHPDYRPMLQDYYDRAIEACGSGNCHTPHILEEALSWHVRFQKTGTMKL